MGNKTCLTLSVVVNRFGISTQLWSRETSEIVFGRDLMIGDAFHCDARKFAAHSIHYSSTTTNFPNAFRSANALIAAPAPASEKRAETCGFSAPFV